MAPLMPSPRRYAAIWLSFAILLHAFSFIVAFLNTNQVSPARFTRPKKSVPFLSFAKQKQESEIPANLKRKIKAKRPPLGHVVPKAVRTKGSGGSANPRLRPQGKAREAGMNNPSNLKILGGTARGRRLDSPQVYLRPMMGKVREALFSTLTSFGLYDASTKTRHLDVYCGSGSVGLESLSRGAKHVTFVDLSMDCCAAVQRNVEWCQFGIGGENEKDVDIKSGDALEAIRNPASLGISTDQVFDIITLCPPYEEVVYADLLDALANSPVVGEDTICVVEYPTELGSLPHVVSGESKTLVGVRNRKYGRTVIAMYICNPSGDMEVATSRPEEFVTL